MNLVKMILDLLLSGDVMGKLSSFLGTDDESTKKATSAAVPALLSGLAGLAGLASSDDGIRKLSSVLSGLDPSNIGNMAKMLGGDTSALTNKGSSLLSSLFGDTLVSSIAASVGKYAGLDLTVAKKLLATIGPAVMGMVAGQWKEKAGGIGALTSLLTGQQKNIASALPSGFSLASILGLPSAEGAMLAAGASVANAARRTTDVAEDATASLLKWAVPLAGALAVVMGLWYFFGRGPASDVAQNAQRTFETTTQSMSEVAADVKTSVGDVAGSATETVRTLKPELPDRPEITTITKEVSEIFTTATQSLGNIRDAASAEAALPRLKEMSKKIDGIRNLLDMLPAEAQATLGKLVGEQVTSLQEQTAKIMETPGVSEEVKEKLEGITSKLSGLNLAQVSQDATDIFATLTKTLSGFKDLASAKEAIPQLREVSTKIDGLTRVQEQMSPGGKSMLANVVATARGPLNLLISKIIATLGVDASVVKPVLDEIATKLTGLSTQISSK